MPKIAKGLVLLAIFFVLALGSPCWAGTAGSFAKALKDRFCGGTSGAQWYGCYAYDLVKNKSSAKSICYKNGCGGKFGSGANYETCKTGCDKAYNADTN